MTMRPTESSHISEGILIKYSVSEIFTVVHSGATKHDQTVSVCISQPANETQHQYSVVTYYITMLLSFKK